MAGTGKSTTLNKIKEALADNTYLTMAYTHKASIIVNGNTFHKVFGIDVKTRRPDLRLIKSYVSKGIYTFPDRRGVNDTLMDLEYVNTP